MNKSVMQNILIIFMMLAALLAGSSSYAADGVTATYLYHLSNFVGTVPYQMPHVRVDNVNHEIYVMASTGIKIFNYSGMEIYNFNRQYNRLNEFNNDFAVDDEGRIFFLTSNYNPLTDKKTYSLGNRNYMMMPHESIELTGIPPELINVAPSRLVYHQGFLYLGDTDGMQVIVIDRQGRYQKHFDLKVAFPENSDKEDVVMSDFAVDRDGSILFTAPVIGSAYRVSPNGAVTIISRRGSGRGKFGIPSSIIADAKGNYLVADRLKSCIIVFNKDLKCIAEFGFRGPNPENITGPTNLAIDDLNRLYVSQLAFKGVSVFQLSSDI
jgi:hypothetical protein